jgi:hypothetical protein
MFSVASGRIDDVCSLAISRLTQGYQAARSKLRIFLLESSESEGALGDAGQVGSIDEPHHHFFIHTLCRGGDVAVNTSAWRSTWARNRWHLTYTLLHNRRLVKERYVLARESLKTIVDHRRRQGHSSAPFQFLRESSLDPTKPPLIVDCQPRGKSWISMNCAPNDRQSEMVSNSCFHSSLTLIESKESFPEQKRIDHSNNKSSSV